MDAEPTGGPDEAVGAAATRAEQQAEDEIVGLPWDDELPVALGEEIEVRAPGSAAVNDDDATPRPTDDFDEVDEVEGADGDDGADGGDGDDPGGRSSPAFADMGPDMGDDMGELYEDDHVGGRRNALPRRVESWRSRSATGAIATAIAMGLQQVFEPERRRPAAVAEAPSDPYDDDDPITVDYVPDDAEGTTVHVKPWLLQKGEPG